jgi:putative DNA methylase
MIEDLRLIEDVIAVDAISEEAAREKQGARRGHPSSLHQWWARRPLAAARAAVYATLVRAEDTPLEARSETYLRALCRWGASESAIADARSRVLAAHGGTPPRVLDLFAGGGAIPLEAARLGCEAIAIELNPVAHIVELAMLDYPQRFGSSLADDVRAWGERWVDRTWERVGHLYPRVVDTSRDSQMSLEAGTPDARPTYGHSSAYLWTRTVRCPNPTLEPHDVALVRQTWLVKKRGRSVALKPRVARDTLRTTWEVVEVASADDLGFDPASFSKGGQSTCLVCGAALDSDYVRTEGLARRMGIAPLAAVVPGESGKGRRYIAAGEYPDPARGEYDAVLGSLTVSPPTESLPRIKRMTGGMCTVYGLTQYRDLFTPRQIAMLSAFAQGVSELHGEMLKEGMPADRATGVATHLGLVLDRTVDFSSSLCRWVPQGEFIASSFSRQAFPMVWDFAEANPFGGSSGDVRENIERAALVIEFASTTGRPTRCARASATDIPEPDETIDAVITDPPYYDNISYADLSDFFYVWLKRSIGFLFPEHLDGELTPKQREAVAVKYRHSGNMSAARAFYEEQMAASFKEAHRVLKPGAPLVCVYAHKTTLGWASLVEALRRAGFAITEAWPLDTEMPERSIGQGTASLASSIFLVARRRDHEAIGQFADVERELDAVIAERLERLTEAGVSGSDLVIATIGAGLRPFTRYSAVELPNGEEILAEQFLDQVQARVLNAVLAQVHGLANGVGSIDAATRYYVIARYALGYVDVDFDEANNLARTAGVELGELANGAVPLASIGKGKVRLLDFEMRGQTEGLGFASEQGRSRLIDILHGLLWRAAHDARSLRAYLDETQPDPQKLRLVAQALQGKGLAAENEQKPAEARACERLLGAWRTLVDDNLLTTR